MSGAVWLDISIFNCLSKSKRNAHHSQIIMIRNSHRISFCIGISLLAVDATANWDSEDQMQCFGFNTAIREHGTYSCCNPQDFRFFFANCLQVLIFIQSASCKRQMIDWINSVTRVINRIKQFSFYTFRVYLQKLNEAVHSFGLHFGSLRQSRGEKAKNCKLTESDGECIGNSVVYSIWTSVFHEMQTNEFENRNLKLNEC